MDRDYTGKTTSQLFEEALNQIGASMLPDKGFCARLLAYTYVYGGECTVYHPQMNNEIMIAQEKFKIYGGEIPDRDGVLMIQAAIGELELYGLKTPWLQDIYSKYNLKPPNNVSTDSEIPDAYRRAGKDKRGTTVPEVRDELPGETV